MLSFCVRSSGAIVALPPAAKIASSTCSRSLAVRAVMTTCAPFAASALAVAAPIPRLAPVTSATRPERGWSFIALLGLIQAFCEQCELRSEEHTSELQSLMRISYAVFCLKKKKHSHLRYYKDTYEQVKT